MTDKHFIEQSIKSLQKSVDYFKHYIEHCGTQPEYENLINTYEQRIAELHMILLLIK